MAEMDQKVQPLEQLNSKLLSYSKKQRKLHQGACGGRVEPFGALVKKKSAEEDELQQRA